MILRFSWLFLNFNLYFCYQFLQQQQQIQMIAAQQNTLCEKEQKIFYDCQCGKRYEAFPGLYLHFKRKHNIKISSHSSTSNSRERRNTICKVITYFFTEQPQSKDLQVQSLGQRFYPKLKLILQEFYRGEGSLINEQEFSLMALDKFCIYMTTLNGDSTDNFEEEFFQRLPQCLNDFFLEQIQKGFLTERNFQKWRKTLVSLSDWLHNKGYCEATVVKNDCFVFSNTKS